VQGSRSSFRNVTPRPSGDEELVNQGVREMVMEISSSLGLDH
jgi:hypothetical protein